MKKMLLILAILVSAYTHAQVLVGTATSSINSSAQLEVSSTSKGFLPPRMTRTELNAIASPTIGLLVYCTDCGPKGKVQIYNGVIWTNPDGTSSALNLPSVTTFSIADTTITTANSGAVVTNTGGSNILFKGVCWSTHKNPTLADSARIGNDSLLILHSLQPNTTYYVRAVAANAVGIAYGNQLEFKTKKLSIYDHYAITGSFGFIWIAFWLVYYHSPSKHPQITPLELEFINQDDDQIVKDENMRWSELLQHKQTYAICFTRFISDWVWGFFLFWIPDFLNKTQGINLSAMVLPLIIIYSVSSLGGISGGWISSKLIQSGKSIDYSRKVSIFMFALLVLPVLLVSYIGNLWIVVFLIAIATAGHQGWASNIFSIISDIYPKKAVASMMGLSGFVGAIGAALSASFVGIILESTNSYYFIFILVSVIYLFNWLIIKIFIPEIKSIQL